MPRPVALEPTYAALAALQGTSLQVLDEWGRDLLPLVVTSVSERVEVAGWQRWQVDLHGPLDRPLEQATYLLRADAGDLWLFLVPSARDDGGITYVATFNQPVEGSTP